MTAAPAHPAMTFATRYRAVAIINGDRVALDGTTERKTKAALLTIIQKNGSKLLNLMSDTDLDAEWTYKDGAVRMGSVQFFLEFIPAHEVVRAA